MDEISGIIKVIAEIAIAGLTAFGAIWATYRTTRSEAKVEVSNSLESLVSDLNKERQQLLAIISELREENTDLRKQLARKK